ncbi:DnaJ domain-containing protein [Comamonas piscis]|uniref:DnaJ domain-containing protein n=1 Tax=Comamonas piscis TaxID=1562974 RepID=A0A7G5EJJ7_9BURK|nr:DnaJ C-terminal domain-containing protein [Comamonas piscis]QMV74172.1 DnaJ domain-containing protein [Comamonas piscis]WSO32612.1 DnaJ C-terminal domain-containing protein [Comamonas piscis]
MDSKNYYDVLGVDKKASADDIKKAFRKLARKYHPDLSKEKDAQQRMAEVNEANAVLSDAQKRAEYDEMLNAPRGFDPRAGNPFRNAEGFGGGDYEFRRQSMGGDADYSDFFREMFGNAARGQHRTGAPPPMRGDDQHASIELDLMDSYQGAEKTLTLHGQAYDGDGSLRSQERQLQVKIPPGVREGQMIRLAGQGGPGYQGGPAGDLLLEVHFRPDKRWRAEGKDVYMPVAISPWEAALGGSAEVTTPAGTLEVGIPAGWSAGRKLRIKGKGLPSATPGDLYLELQLHIPPATNEPERAAYADFAKAFPHYQPRQGD